MDEGATRTKDSPIRARPERGLGHYLRDVVYGASDGVTTTTAVIAGASGAGFEPEVAIVLGLANLAADGISMGASNYLGLKSEIEQSGNSVDAEMPWRHGVATTLAFMIAGAAPLFSYCVNLSSEETRFKLAMMIASLTLAGVGATRSRFVPRSPMRCGLEMVLVAGGASAAAYFIGLLVAPLVN